MPYAKHETWDRERRATRDAKRAAELIELIATTPPVTAADLAVQACLLEECLAAHGGLTAELAVQIANALSRMARVAA